MNGSKKEERSSYGRNNVLTGQMIHEIVGGSRAALGKKLLSVVLYGSVARGDNDSESDIDIALFVAEKLDREEDRAVVRCFSDLCMEYDMVFSPMDIERRKFEEWKDILPYYQNISKEGIVLWAAA